MVNKHITSSADLKPKKRKKRSRVAKFLRGYFMIIGVLTNVYLLLRLAVWFLVEVAKMI